MEAITPVFNRKEELKSQIAWMEEDLAQLKEELSNLEE